MRFSETMRLFTLWIFLIGFTSSVLGQGGRRVIRVRKTGEFGRRVIPISTFYEPPKRQSLSSDPLLQVSETRRSDRIEGIRKPSQKLELPSFGQMSDQDSVAEETGDSPQGYAYPDPQVPSGGYDYSSPGPAPAAEYPQTDGEDPYQQLDESPTPVKPDIVAEISNDPKVPAFGLESERNVDSQVVTTRPPPPPVPVNDSPVADTSAQCNEHDHDCWPRGYKGEIPGDAGTDYPILSEIVDTPFECDNVQYSGYYADADEQARCQIFHICLKGNQYRKTQKWSFLCPNGTVFSQNDFVCVWWNNAPECNSGVLNELSLRNEELGWDNLTETEGSRSANNFDVRTAMSSLFNANLQSSSSNSRLKNTLPAPTPTRRPTAAATQNYRTSIPYRVPVKINTGIGARTKLKEVSNNGLQGGQQDEFGVEHDGEESETYETSLKHQSEARHVSASSGKLLKSESEAYEQKSVSDSVAPLLVNRQPVSTDDYQNNYNVPQQGNYEDEEQVPPALVMMPTQQRNPDGSDGYAEVPVMMNNGGYSYPKPTSTPGPQYLPPKNEYSPPSTTEPPTTTTQVPSTEDSYDSEGGYQYQTTEQPAEPSFSPQLTETTTEQSGYNYPSPTTTEQAGYNYPSPTTTERVQQEELSSPVYEEEEEQGGYGYESTTTPEQTTPRVQVTTTSSTTTTSQQEPAGGYLPPKPHGLYNVPKSAAALQASADVLSLPNSDDDTLDALIQKQFLSTVTNSPESDNTDYTDATALDDNDVTEGGGYSDKEATPGYHLPTPASSPAVGPTAGDNLDSQDKVNQILKEIENGGAEVRDETGKKIDFAELQKLILSTPNGLLALQKADPSVTTDSSTSSSTEVPSSSTLPASSSSSDATRGGSELQTIQTIEDVADNNRAPAPAPFLPQENYFTNNRVVNIKHPGFEISAPSKEFENHSVEQNSIDSGLRSQQTNNFNSGFNSYETQRPQVQQNVNYQRPQAQFVQNFAPPTQYTPTPQVYYQRQQVEAEPQQQQQQFRVQQSQSPAPETYVRPSVPQPDQYYQQQPQQPVVQPSTQPEKTYYQPQQQFQTNSQISQQQYFQPQQSHSQQQNNFFEQTQRQPEAPQYLPPPPSTQQAQIYRPTPTQPRVPLPQPRDLTNNIQLQQSFSLPVPQASSTNTRKVANPIDIKIVPALFVHQHTRVENSDGSSFNNRAAAASQRSNTFQNPNLSNNQQSSRNLNNNNSPSPNGRFSLQASNSAYLPFSAQTENIPVKVRAPRLNAFSNSDALPKYEPFTAEDGRTAEEIQKYHHEDLRQFQRENNVSPTQAAEGSHLSSVRHSLPFSSQRNGRHFIGSGSRGQLELPSDDQSSISNNFYPGRDGSLGVKLTYN